MRPSGQVALAAFVCALGVAHQASAGRWTHPRHDADGTNRADGTARIRLGEGLEPGFAHVIEGRRRVLAQPRLFDVDGDGEPEVLTLHRGRVVALNPGDGSFRWQSVARDFDRIVAVDDLDGDGTTEIVASASSTGGGLAIVDAATGALLSEVKGLPFRSGIEGAEVAVGDLDGDGSRDVVHAAGLYGLARVWGVTLAGGIDAPAQVERSFVGYANFTPLRLGRFLPGASGVVIDQGPRQTLLARCTPSTPGAACDGAAGTLCLCERGSFQGVHPNYAFGDHHVLDTDGDGLDEVLTVASHPVYTNAVGLLSFADGLAGGSPDASALRRWYRHYPTGTIPTRLRTPTQPPADLDGDGTAEVVVSFVHNVALDIDGDGAPIDDGIDHPGAVSFAALSALDGSVRATALDRFAYGHVDLDGDGARELVVSPTSGWTYQTGLRGLQLVCDPSCGWVERWSVANVAQGRSVSSPDGTGAPAATLVGVLDADGDGDDELLAYGDASVVLLDAGTAGAFVVASAPLAADETVRVVDVASRRVLVVGETAFRILGPDLSTVAGPSPIPASGSEPFLAGRLTGAPGAEALYGEDAYLQGLDTAPAGVLWPRVALVDDLDGDGRDDVVSYRRPSDGLGAGFEVSVASFDPATGSLVTRWTRASDGDPDLDGASVMGALHFATGDFDGEGDRDLVFAASEGGVPRLVVLDGDDGAVDAVLAPSVLPATNTPLWIGDVARPDGSFAPDGVDDIVVPGSNATEVLVVGHAGSLASAATGFYHGVGAHADVDGDGVRELVATQSATLANQLEVVEPDASLAVGAGPIDLGLPTGATQILSFAALDAAEGLDPIYATGDGGVHAYAGADGAGLPGFPVYLSAGGVSAAPAAEPLLPTALMVIDVDDDGAEEAIVGTKEGLLVALELTPPGFAWQLQMGAKVTHLAAGDVDGDGDDELLVSTDGARGIVVDGLGVVLEVEPLAIPACLASAVDVSGTAEGIASVDVWIGGVLAASELQVVDGAWSGSVVVSTAGVQAVEVRGRDAAGALVAVASSTLDVPLGTPPCPMPEPPPPADPEPPPPTEEEPPSAFDPVSPAPGHVPIHGRGCTCELRSARRGGAGHWGLLVLIAGALARRRAARLHRLPKAT